MDIDVGLEAIAEASKKLSNWGRWGEDDHIGTLNHVTPHDVVEAGEADQDGQGVRAQHPTRPERSAGQPLWWALQPRPPDAGDGHRCHRRTTGLEPAPLRGRHDRPLRPGCNPLGRAGTHLLRREGLQQPRRQADRFSGAARPGHRALARQDERARACYSTSRDIAVSIG